MGLALASIRRLACKNNLNRTEKTMKNLALWVLLIAAALPLTACHWRHRHHRFADGYYGKQHAQNDSGRFEAAERLRGA
jgi:hypothetical protein